MRKSLGLMLLVCMILSLTILPVKSDEVVHFYVGEQIQGIDNWGLEGEILVKTNMIVRDWTVWYISIGAAPNFIALGVEQNAKEGYRIYWDLMDGGYYAYGVFSKTYVGAVVSVGLEKRDSRTYQFKLNGIRLYTYVFRYGEPSNYMSAFAETPYAGNSMLGSFLNLAFYKNALYEKQLWEFERCRKNAHVIWSPPLYALSFSDVWYSFSIIPCPRLLSGGCLAKRM